MRFILLSFFLFLLSTLTAQDSTNKSLSEVIVTGVFKPQLLKNNVYQLKVINQKTIKNSGASSVQQLLNTQLNFRFNNDNTLGTSNVSLMGMSGRNIKILVDGVPIIDRSETKESLTQIDINSIEKIEIVEGPMAVTYGTDALAGVINFITKKNKYAKLFITAKVQEETIGKEYQPLNFKGLHTQTLQLSTQQKKWNISSGISNYTFAGFEGDEYGRGKTWKPKDQLLYNAKLSFTKNKLSIFYKLDNLNETINSRNEINYNTLKAIDQQFNTNRTLHQLQTNYTFNNKWKASSTLAYTNYSRATITTRHDFEKNTNTLTTGDGEQDVSTLKNILVRKQVYYEPSNNLNIQAGFELVYDKASGQRINNEPTVTDAALFTSAEYKINKKLQVRTGLRFIKNSLYPAPPVIPSLHIKYDVAKNITLKGSVAKGFRSPSLRELYFYFVDVNHNIIGNTNLKAEQATNYSAAINFNKQINKDLNYSLQSSFYYNTFNNQIDFALVSPSSNQYTYLNTNQAKTLGTAIENSFGYKKLFINTGIGVTGFYRQLDDDKNYKSTTTKKFLWSPEFTTTINYTLQKLNSSLNVIYKFTGEKPRFEYGKNAANEQILFVAKTASFNWLDVNATTTLTKNIQVQYGAKNIFNIKDINNTAANSGTIHSSAATTSIGTGTSYFVALNFSLQKK